MALRWTESFQFGSFSQYQAVYGTSGGLSGSFLFNVAHPSQPRKAMQTQAGLGILLTLPGGATPSTMCLGMNLNISATTNGTLALWQTRNATPANQMCGLVVADSPGVFRLVVARGSYDGPREVLLKSPPLNEGEWYFLEFEVYHHVSQGTVRVFCDGGLLAQVVNVQTDSVGFGAPWASTLFPGVLNSNFITKICDAYLTDEVGGGRFSTLLGPIEAASVPPTEDREMSGWSFSTDSNRLLVLAGQSNMGGRGTTSKPVGDSRVVYWNQFTQTADVVRPNNNTFGMLFPSPPSPIYWGPEVRVVERIAASTTDPAFRTYLVKAAQDASWVHAAAIPLANYCWFFGATNDLLDGNNNLTDNCLISYCRRLIASRPSGWTGIQDVTLVWYQGESEATNLETAEQWSLYFDAMWERFKEALQADGCTCPINLILVRIHKDTRTDLFPHTSLVRMQQTQFTKASKLISVDDLSLLPDGVHLNEAASTELGNRIFDQWLVLGSDASRNLQDLDSAKLTVGRGISATAGGASFVFGDPAASVPNLNNSMLLSVNRKAIPEVAASLNASADLGSFLFPTLSAASLCKQDRIGGIALPETVTSAEISIVTTGVSDG